MPWRGQWDPWEVSSTVIGEITVDMPGAAKVCRTLYQQGSWPKGLEGHNKMCEMELSLQVQLDGDRRDTIL